MNLKQFHIEGVDMVFCQSMHQAKWREVMHKNTLTVQERILKSLVAFVLSLISLDKLGGSSSDMNSSILRGQLSKITQMSSRAAWLT